MQELRETFHVEQPLSTVWSRLSIAEDDASADSPAADGLERGLAGCRIPGFPSFDGGGGCQASVLLRRPQRQLLAVKEDQPCSGSKIRIDIGPANASGWPTRVTVAQSELPAAMAAMPDAVRAHWQRIVADFRLYLERGVVAPATAWGADFGAITEQTPTGLVLAEVGTGGFAQRCGMIPGDLLLTLRDIRIHNIGELWTVLALLQAGEATTATWVRDRVRSATVPL